MVRNSEVAISAGGEEAVSWGTPGSLEHLCSDETTSGRDKYKGHPKMWTTHSLVDGHWPDSIRAEKPYLSENGHATPSK